MSQSDMFLAKKDSDQKGRHPRLGVSRRMAIDSDGGVDPFAGMSTPAKLYAGPSSGWCPNESPLSTEVSADPRSDTRLG